ncbi:hypothetical protein SELMODRAFT_425135 [Selaginella moellendorffii]|uniref:Mitochondrial import inner membrane translocase subunit TIM50 n=2 Tax=Selaginella moellendorffii TaxID=88036 RepID=D8SS46_SELML|nr:hypothetical protein SELMODRAFT_425135 [Selaginella moellendorffii]
MADIYELVLWTSAPSDYAANALRQLQCKGSEFSHLLSNMDFGADLTKDVTKLGRDLSKVVLVDDDRDLVPDHVVDNAIVIESYEGDNDDDCQLSNVAEILRKLAVSKDVRGELRKLRDDGALDHIEVYSDSDDDVLELDHNDDDFDK